MINNHELLNQISIVEYSPNNPSIEQFETMLKSWIPKDFVIDFYGQKISNHPNQERMKVIVVLYKECIIGGGIIAEGLSLNDFKDKKKLALINGYMKDDYYNLSYFYIDSNYRSKGIGSLFLSEVNKFYQNVWLATQDKLLPFYQKNGYEIVVRRLEDEKSSLLKYK